MERNDRPHAPQSGRIWFGAPVAMVLATCVSAQTPAAEQIVPAALQPAADLGCVVRGEATQARKAIAHQAVYTIHAVDRIACTRAFEASGLEVCSTAPHDPNAILASYRCINPTTSNHQASAP